MPENARALVDLYRRSYQSALGRPPAHGEAEILDWMTRDLIASCETWVALDESGEPAGFVTLRRNCVEQLYVAPRRQGQSIGSALLEKAKERRPEGLHLHVFEANARARRFYEHRGFRVVDHSNGEDNEEGLPDLELAWTSAAR